jgi:hypothetical protein
VLRAVGEVGGPADAHGVEGDEEDAEEEDLGGEEGPHAQGGGVALLEGVVELFGGEGIGLDG